MLGFLIGFVVGNLFGIFMCCVLIMAGRDEEDE